MTLFKRVQAICTALAPNGWRQLLLEATAGEMDICAANLEEVLARDLKSIDQSLKGFEDFAATDQAGQSGAFPSGARLLLHAFASPRVTEQTDGSPLTAYPSLAQIDCIENLLFANRHFSRAQLQQVSADQVVAIAVFACEYRPADHTLDKQGADFCFSRTGLSRSGTADAHYDRARRTFDPLDPADPHAFRVMPVRYVPYLAVQKSGDNAHLPCHPQKGDDGRQFWVPFHKLFDGPECIEGLDLRVTLRADHVNEKLARLLRVLNDEGYDTGTPNSDLDAPPFTTREGLAAFADPDSFGPGLLMPQLFENKNLIKAAEFGGKPVTLKVAKGFEKSYSDTHRLTHYFDSLYVEPEGPLPPSGGGSTVSPTGKSHRTPEIINARHVIKPDGQRVNLNEEPDVYDAVRAGGYEAQLYEDFAGDGAIQASCPQLANLVPQSVPAYSIIAAPDFFPYCHQLAQMESWDRAPKEIRNGLWAVPPYALCDTRYGPNVHLKAFEDRGEAALQDKTVTAIVPLLQNIGRQAEARVVPTAPRPTALSDGASGVFDPGWDVTTDTPVGKEDNSNLFLTGYGLGSPFVEDAKICAALGTFWPAVAPDSTRSFAPYSYWPTVSPLTDEETGQTGDMPWDGVFGPKWLDPGESPDGKPYVDYLDFNYVDYVDNTLAGLLTASLTAKVDNEEYERRVYNMAWVYWALGIRFPEREDGSGGDRKSFFARVQEHLQAKAKWAVISFTKQARPDRDLDAALADTGSSVQGDHLYRFELFRWDKDRIISKPESFKRHLVEALEIAQLYTDGTQVWHRRSDSGSLKDAGPWQCQKIPLDG